MVKENGVVCSKEKMGGRGPTWVILPGQTMRDWVATATPAITSANITMSRQARSTACLRIRVYIFNFFYKKKYKYKCT